jgi:ATP-binding cassette subfamily C protein LapB
MTAAPQHATTTVGPVPLHESVVFLARFLGTPVQVDRLRDSLASHDLAHGATLTPEALGELLRHAGLVASLLPAGSPRRATELPALLVGEGGRCLVAISLQDGRFECHLPGIEGSSWLGAEALAQEVPQARWMAVRPTLHFDTRSLLYTLPKAKRWFWDTFNRNRWMFAWALLGTLALNLFGTLVPFYSMAVYDRVIPNNAMGSLGVLTVAAVLIIGFELVMRLLRSHLLEAVARRIDVALSAQVFAQCLRMRAASRPASGGVLANTVRDFEAVREFFATSTLTVLGDLPFMLLYLAVIALVGGWLGLVPLAAIPILLGIALLARRPLARKVNESMQETSQRTAHLFETMNGLDNLKSLGAEAWSRRKWEGLTQAISQNSLETREITSRVNHLNTMVLGVANVAVVAVGAILINEHAMTLGQIIAVSLLTGRALAPVSQIAGLVVRWEQTKLSYEALDKIMQAPTDEAAVSLQAPPLSGRLEFRDVSFAYPNQPPVVDALNLRIRPGERVGIIGKLGSGKSTLLRLILNQYAPSAGSVLVDDIVNTQLEPLSLRRQIGYVPQDVTLFHGTLRENVELGRVQADDTALLEAMRVAGLDEIVAHLPAGVGTQVGGRGDRLSGGQRQIVAIARALFTRPRLLLLDEPSSMIDPGNEQQLISRLRALPDTTTVLVTHRMAMLALVDRLVVMDRGRVVADGRRDDMLRSLARQQAQAPTQTGPAAPDPAGHAANDVPGRTGATRPGAGLATSVADRVRGER